MLDRQKDVGNTGAIRKSFQTELDIFRRIHRSPSITRKELAEQSGLSSAALTGIVSSLLSKKLVAEERGAETQLGRRRQALRLRDNLAYAVGVDLGTFNLRVVLTDVNGSIVASREERSEMGRGREAVVNRSFAVVREVIASSGVSPSLIRGIGIAFSGVIDVENGVVVSYPRPGQVEQWKNVPLREIAQTNFNMPCYVEDSVRAIATIEKHFGAGRSLKDFVYVDIGMGVGSALFFDGNLYRGSNGSAGEFGHITVEEEGPLCCCGSRGCLEAMASCGAIIDSIRHAIERGVGSKVFDLASRQLNDISMEMVASAAEDNDGLTSRALAEAGGHIGAATANLVNLLNPHAIIFGGALFRAAPELMMDHVRRSVRHHAMERSMLGVELLISSLDATAGARGVSRLMIEELLPALFRENL